MTGQGTGPEDRAQDLKTGHDRARDLKAGQGTEPEDGAGHRA